LWEGTQSEKDGVAWRLVPANYDTSTAAGKHERGGLVGLFAKGALLPLTVTKYHKVKKQS